MICKIMLLVFWGLLLLFDFKVIIYNRIDAGTGLLWVFIAGLAIAGIAFVSPGLLEQAGNAVMFLLIPAEFIMVCILHRHEQMIIELRRKNNELAMQIALIYDHMKFMETRPRIVKRKISKERHLGDE